MELDKTTPKTIPNSIMDYIVLDHGKLEKYYSLSTEQYGEDQWLLVKHIYGVFFTNVYREPGWDEVSFLHSNS